MTPPAYRVGRLETCGGNRSSCYNTTRGERSSEQDGGGREVHLYDRASARVGFEDESPFMGGGDGCDDRQSEPMAGTAGEDAAVGALEGVRVLVNDLVI